jgi:uracil-DNA glycosylase
MTKTTVILVGSNPSAKSPNDVPFDPSVRSARTLGTWIEGIDAEFLFMNVSDVKTQSNKPLSTAQIKGSLSSLKEKLDQYPKARVVALGKTAEKALSMLNVHFLALPHPSGMNRMLNDPDTVRLTKENLKSFSSVYNPITDAT